MDRPTFNSMGTQINCQSPPDMGGKFDADLGGKKYDGGKADFTLLPLWALAPVVRVLEMGARKYARDSWQNVPDGKRRYTAAALRHLAAVTAGDQHDHESKLHHVAHAACNLIFLLGLMINDGTMDADGKARVAK
jgi:hypothetical protein